MYFLCDCNNFYASCERLFQPNLVNKPVVVLSNNDGCIVARSQEAKALGIKMGAPYFKHKDFLAKNKVSVFSSNYPLYGDISNRVMKSLADLGDSIEVYSIDEAFVSNRMQDKQEIIEWSKHIRQTAQQNIGITLSIGAAPTKTLAKAANEYVKSNMRDLGVFALNASDEDNPILQSLKVGAIWGVGRQSAKKLNSVGIYNALQLKKADANFLKEMLNVNAYRTNMELNGKDCIVTDNKENPRTVACTRSFAKTMTKQKEVEKTVSAFAHKALERLRKNKLLCKGLTVFLETSRFRDNHYADSISYRLPRYSASTPEILMYVKMGIEHIYRPGHQFNKAGVVLFDTSDGSEEQLDFFNKTYDNSSDDNLMQALDEINTKMGNSTLSFASALGTSVTTVMKQEFLSPDYTGRWDQLPIVKAI